ncbi:SMI1/KNR4 family protein [Streptomyces shaanxiensis]|uniref:Knr4/Smi1-like domain-containing protein n=1 Tax=Streptomyces shaanxiensis TaxID=653357 RepID=A0ABP7WDB4_9ACTN
MNAALARLTDVVPPPSEPRNTDWDAAERRLGVVLPTDYKELIRTYGGSNWDDYLYLLDPGCPNDNYDLVEWEDQQTEALEGLWEFEKRPAELADAGSRVIPWATTDNGECLYWLVRAGRNPDEWTVMVNEARGDRWEHFPMNCTEFLAAVLQGDLRSALLSSRFPLTGHEFRRLVAV